MKTNNLKIVHLINLRKLAKPVALCISALFILSMISTFSPTAVKAATLSTFGNTAISAHLDQNDPNAQSVSYFTCTSTGTVTDIMAYIEGATSGKAIAALYAVNGGSADALLEQSNAANIGTTFSWVDFQLPTPSTVTAGTTYGLAVMGNVLLNVMEASGTGQRDHNAVGTYTNGFKNPFGAIWGTDDNGAMDIYATGTSSPTPTPSPSPTASPSLYSPNLAVIPTDWYTTYGNGPQILSVNNAVEHSSGNPSIETDAHTAADVNKWRECDGVFQNVQPGDHVVLSVWIKTGHSTLGYDNVAGYGALLEFDCYGATGLMFEYIGLPNNQAGNDPSLTNPNAFSNLGPASNWDGVLVPWNSGWTHKVIDCVIPATVPDEYHGGGQQVVTSICPIVVAGLYIEGPNYLQDQGTVWFADAQLTISK